jgi:hypothetical protein
MAAEGVPIAEGEAICAGELVDVAITGRLLRIFAARGNWWARVTLGGAAAAIAEAIDVPLIAVRLPDRLYRRVGAPAEAPPKPLEGLPASGAAV